MVNRSLNGHFTNKSCCLKFFLVTGCSTAVECTTRDQEVMGSNLDRCRAYFSYLCFSVFITLLSLLKKVPQEDALQLAFPYKDTHFGVQLVLKRTESAQW